MYYTGRQTDTQYTYIAYLMTINKISAFLTLDIEYWIESGEPTTVYRCHIICQLAIIYSIDLMNIFGEYQS